MKANPVLPQLAAQVAFLGGVLCLVFVGVTYGTAAIMSHLGPSQRSETVLAERIASAREIRAALAKPVPQPERLGPITQKLATESLPETPEVKPSKPSRQVRDAYAYSRSQQYQAYDRHRVY
jgi:hypothetical protein